MNNIFFEKAKRKALKSSCYIRVSAIGFDKNGDYLGAASNHSRFSRYGGGVHAEINLLKKFGKRVKTIIICRVGKSGKFRPIDPCDSCKRTLDRLNIKIMTIKGSDEIDE